jgi:hypothetical protein
VKETSEDFKPRRDGWFEHKGTWDEVVVGTVLADPAGSRTKRYEVTATAMGADPIPFGQTLWMRIREQATGEEYTIPPRSKVSTVTILTQDPRDKVPTGQREDPTDAEAIALLVRELGATHLATRDNVTGEITCPDYASGRTHEGGQKGGCRDEMEHLRFAHGYDTSALEAMEFDKRIVALTSLHGRFHMPRTNSESPGGFPHRHVPEDLTILTGKRA